MQITSSMYSNVTTSTRINSSSVHMYFSVCFIRNQYNMSNFYTGFVYPIQYSTWCQNRGCICISSTRGTYRSNPAVPCILPSILKVQFYKVEFPKKRREKIQGENFNLHSNSNPRVIQCLHMQFNKFPVILCRKKTILHTELILLQEFSKKYYNYKAHPMHTDTRHPPAAVPHASNHSTWQNKAPRLLQYTQASSNSTCRNSIQSSKQHPHTPYKIPQLHVYKVLQGEIGFFQKGSSITYQCNTKVSVFQLLILAFTIILQEINSIQSSENSM